MKRVWRNETTLISAVSQAEVAGIADVDICVQTVETKGIGFHECAKCKAPTPYPPNDVLVGLVGNGDHYVWPFDDWQPEGWLKIEGEPYCPKCSAKIRKAMRP